MSDSYDVVIIGAGPGGYVCAIRAAQLGKRVAIVEKRPGAKGAPALGGTCLNIGCIPSKALLDSSEHFHNAAHAFAGHGIVLEQPPRIDVAKMMQRKDKVVTDLTGGIAWLMKKHGIEVVAGTGRLAAADTVTVSGEGGERTLTAGAVVLAMGSVPSNLPRVPIDGERVVTSDQAIAFAEVPGKLVVVGGGVIGLELGSVWARLGSEVTVVEYLEQIVPGFDADIAKALQKSLERIGMHFQLGAKVEAVDERGVLATAKDGSALHLPADKVLVAIGRRALSEGCGLEEAGVALDEHKRVQVDERLMSSVPGVYAIGDLVPGAMLAHKAEEEGIAVAETIAGGHGHVDHRLIPGVVYTWPELAQVGMGAEAAQAAGRAVRIGSFAFQANGRAKAAGDSEGFVKVVADAGTDELLGVTILGPRASDLIGEAVAVMAFGGSAEDIALLCHPHPTFSEAVKEAALDSLGRVIHS